VLGSNIVRIRERIRSQRYDITAHAMEEMAEDGFDIIDVENAMLGGKIIRVEKDDPRGTKYVIEGVVADGNTTIGIVGRFTGTGRYLIITVYEVVKM